MIGVCAGMTPGHNTEKFYHTCHAGAYPFFVKENLPGRETNEER